MAARKKHEDRAQPASAVATVTSAEGPAHWEYAGPFWWEEELFTQRATALGAEGWELAAIFPRRGRPPGMMPPQEANGVVTFWKREARGNEEVKQ